MNTDDFNYSLDNLCLADRWILTRLNETIDDVTRNMEKYEFNLVGSKIYGFIWNDFCDWYIELSKAGMNDTSKSVLIYTLKCILKLLHPFMPFVTEEIYLKLPNHLESIMLESYPVYDKKYVFDDVSDMDSIIQFIKFVRKLKLDKGVKDIVLKYNNDILRENEYIINSLLKPVNLDISKLESINYSFLDDDVIIYYDDSISKAAFEDKLYQEKADLESSINRRKKLLANENYVNKAPKEIVDKDREALKKEEAMLKNILDKLEEL